MNLKKFSINKNLQKIGFIFIGFEISYNKSKSCMQYKRLA